VSGRRLLAAPALALLLSGCGVPTGGAPHTIAASEVPFGLAQARPTTSAAPSAEPRLDPARVFFLAADERLTPEARDIDRGAAPEERLSALLTQLAAGPTSAERDQELSTALPPGVRLGVARLEGGTATIDITGPGQAPSGASSRRAVAQIVLTATSAPGVDAVRLTFAGTPVEAPLPSGQLTSAALTAADYAPFLTGSPASPS
jgi:spore germination protein GerM